MCSALVKIDKRSYRQIAKENWGLTDEQMKGMHVHHRLPRSKGGTNDPSNLYVCSAWFHKHIWHSGEEWIDWAEKGGRKGAQVTRQKWLNGEFKTGFELSTVSQQAERGRKGGATNRDRKLGVCSEDFGQKVSANMRSLVQSGSHWFQTEEHRARVIKNNKHPYICQVCGKAIKGKGPLAIHLKSHQKHA
jgi:hypothetical protein